MHGLNAQVISAAAECLAQGHDGWLATVVRTYGSSPRPVGSLMFYSPQFGIVGSLSGGCIEEDLLEQLASGTLGQSEDSHGPWIFRYGHQDQDQSRFALPCGGQLHVMLEPLKSGDSQTQKHIADLNKALSLRQPVTRRILLPSGQKSVIVGPQEEIPPSPVQFTPDAFVHHLSPQYRLLLIGAGEVSRYVAEMAQAMDFSVSLCDPRQQYLDLYPCRNISTYCRLPDDLIASGYRDSYTAIVALSHDPRVDDMALMEALTTEAFFVGAMGSLQTSRKRKARLQDLGLTKAQIAQLRAPVGLDIGSKTPAEIALATVAEIVAVRNRLHQQRSRRGEDFEPLHWPLTLAR